MDLVPKVSANDRRVLAGMGDPSGRLSMAITFLDSRQGRHFADDVASELFNGRTLAEAVDAAVATWMAWKIDKQTQREYGIPRGLPYLTGWVIHHQIQAEMTE